MSGKKARDARQQEKLNLLVNIFGVIEWEQGGAGHCDQCKKETKVRAKLTLYDMYSLDPSVASLSGTLAGELQFDEHMHRVMKSQAAGRFTASVTRFFCWQDAQTSLAQWLDNSQMAIMASMMSVLAGKRTFTAMILYSEPGPWSITTPSIANGYGKPDLSDIFKSARSHKPRPQGDGGVYVLDVDD